MCDNVSVRKLSMRQGGNVLFGLSEQSERDPLLSQPLLSQRSSRFSEKAPRFSNNGDHAREDKYDQEVESNSKEEDEDPSLIIPTSEIDEGGMQFSGSDKNSAPYVTSNLTASNDNLPVSIPVSEEYALGVGDVCGRLGRNASIGQASSIGNSRRQLDEDEENEIVSQAGDIGDRALSRRGSQRGSGRVFADEADVFPITISQVTTSSSGVINPASKNADSNIKHKKELSPRCEYIAHLIHLAVFGILGVLTRYLLQKLFGPSVAGVTSDGSILYLDLPSNMLGSFLMGWLGVVFKSNISSVSVPLATGLTTGYLGSLTTFSGWNQKMLELAVNDHWVLAVLGFLLGLMLADGSISYGVETAEGFRWLLSRHSERLGIMKWKINIYKCNLVALLVLVLMWVGLWTTFGILEKKDFKDGGSDAQLWLACFVSPLGVWMRWWLARLNGRGIGKAGLWKWIPFGTLIANVSAACIMAALSTVKKAVNTPNCDTIATGVQFGLLGCLSTVSTFMAEFHALRKSSHPSRAHVYAGLTIGISFGLGTLIYSVPVWTKGYK